MKILIFSNDYVPFIGGIATHVYYLSQALSEKGNNVHLIVPTPDIPKKLISEKKNGVVINRWGYNNHNNALVRAYRISLAAKRAAEQIIRAEKNFDIVHQQDVRATKWAANWIARRFKMSLVWTYHSHDKFRNGKWFDLFFLKSIGFKADGIIAVTPPLFQVIKKRRNGHCKIAHIPNGVYQQTLDNDYNFKKKYSINDSDFVVLSPNRMDENKGIIYLARAIRKIYSDNNNFSIKFLFPGTGTNIDEKYFAKIRRLLKEEEELGHVIYLGDVPVELMDQLYSVSDLVVNTTLSQAIGLAKIGRAHV